MTTVFANATVFTGDEHSPLAEAVARLCGSAVGPPGDGRLAHPLLRRLERRVHAGHRDEPAERQRLDPRGQRLGGGGQRLPPFQQQRDLDGIAQGPAQPVADRQPSARTGQPRRA